MVRKLLRIWKKLVSAEMLQELPGAGQFIIVMDTWFERLMADQ